jgi:hypothetical protein
MKIVMRWAIFAGSSAAFSPLLFIREGRFKRRGRWATVEICGQVFLGEFAEKIQN